MVGVEFRALGFGLGAWGFRVWEIPKPQIMYLFKHLYKEIIIGKPKKVGSLGSR